MDLLTERIKARRSNFLHRLYELAKGSSSCWVPVVDIVTDIPEGECWPDTTKYLQEEGLVRRSSDGWKFSITHDGIKRVEGAGAPEQSNLPAVHQTINIQHMQESQINQTAAPITAANISSRASAKNFISSKRGLLATIVTVASLIPTLIAVDSWFGKKKADVISKVVTLTIPKGAVQVGKNPGRIDEIVGVPATVLNNTGETIFDLVLDILFSDGTGRQGSLNEYFESVGAPAISFPALPRDQMWTIPQQAISAPNNAKELYASGRREFKVKLQLIWKDGHGHEHRAIELAKLHYLKEREGYTDAFWFKSYGSYDSGKNREALEKRWGLSFDF